MSTPFRTMPSMPRQAGLRLAFLGALWLLGMASPSTATDRLAPDEAVAPRTATPPDIDGDLSDPAWQAAPSVEAFIDP